MSASGLSAQERSDPARDDPSESNLDPEAEIRTEAQEAFRAGVRALEEGRYIDAKTELRRSLDLLPAPSTAFNLAVAYRETGEPTRARLLFDALLNEEYGPVEEPWQTAAERERNLAIQRLVTVHLEILGPAPAEVTIRLDGAEVSILPLEADPGIRTLQAFAPRYLPHEETLDLPPGGELHLSWELTPEPGSNTSSNTFWDTPWPYLGGGAVLVAGAVVTVLLLTRSRNGDRFENPLFGGSVQTHSALP